MDTDEKVKAEFLQDEGDPGIEAAVSPEPSAGQVRGYHGNWPSHLMGISHPSSCDLTSC